MIAVPRVQHEIEMRGPHAELFETTCDALVEGPLGTGKSYAGLYWGHWASMQFPGCRGFISRKTRASMTQSTLVTWEAILGPGHPAIHGTAGRAHRQNYLYPAVNGRQSEVAVVGMNNPEALLSAEYDWGICDELVEYTREDYELMAGRLRNGPNSGMPFSRFIGMTNPRNAFQWVNQAADEGLFKRFLSRHWCNPTFYDLERKCWRQHGLDYLGRIRATYTGARYEQYVKGLWANATGLIYPMFDPAIHVLEARIVREGSRLFLEIQDDDWQTPRIEIMWTAAGVDWGTSAPGAMSVWGFDKDHTAYLLAEIVRSGETRNWWADRAVEMRAEFGVRRFVCDYAEPGSIQLFNDYLGTPGGREESRLATRCEAKDPMGEIAHLGTLLETRSVSPNNPRGSLVYLLKASLRFGRDPEAVSRRRPWCLKMELQDLRWEESEEGKPLKERVDPTQRDDAENAARYVLRWAWKKNLSRHMGEWDVEPGSMADVLGHHEVIERMKRRRYS